MNQLKNQILFVLLVLCLGAASLDVKAQGSTTWSLTGNPVDTTGWVMAGFPDSIFNKDHQALKDFIPLTPQASHMSGAVFYGDPINLAACDEWSVSFDFRIYNTQYPSRGPSKPADGLAFWFLQAPPTAYVDGGAIGIPNYSKGLAVVIDTWDNGRLPIGVGQSMPALELYELDGNPIVGSGFENTAKVYDASLTGINEYKGVNGLNDDTSKYCHAICTYTSRVLSLTITNWAGVDYVMTPYTVTNTYNYAGYFGFSAATGDAYSEHDVKNVQVQIIRKVPPVIEPDTAMLCKGDTLRAVADTSSLSSADLFSWYKFKGSVDGSDSLLSGPLAYDTTYLIADSGEYFVTRQTLCCDYTSNFVVYHAKYSSIALQDPNCYGYNNGSITAYVSEGTKASNYTYSIDSGKSFQTSNMFDNLYAGTYTITVKDTLKGQICTLDSVVILSDPLKLIDTTYVTDVKCYRGNTGSLQVKVQGGVPPFNCSLDGGITTFLITTSGGTYTFSGLIAGTYDMYVSDFAGCVATQQYTITQPDSLSIDTIAVDSVSCWGKSDGKFDIRVSGGTYPYTYSYVKDGSGMSSLFSDSLPAGLDTGTYVVTVNDALGCASAIFTTRIYEPDTLVIDTIVVDSVGCWRAKDGKLDIQVSGGTMPYTYSYKKDGSGSALTFSDSLPTGLDTGTYVVTVNDANSCTPAVFTTHIYEPDTLMIDTIVVDSVSCWRAKDGKLDIQVSGGTMPYTYSYKKDGSSSALTFSDSLPTGLDTGTYVVTVNDYHGCTPATFTTHIYEPDTLMIDTIVVDSVSCWRAKDGKLDIQVSGGTMPYTYSYKKDGSGSALTFSDSLPTGLDTGTYVVTVNDALGCASATFTTRIYGPDTLVIDTIVVDSVSCWRAKDGKLDIQVSGGTMPYSYSYKKDGSGSALTFSDSLPAGLDTGTYVVTVNDYHGCTPATFTTHIYEPDTLVIDTIVVDSVSCWRAKDGKFDIQVSGGTMPYTYSYKKDGSSSALTFSDSLPTGLDTGTYVVTVNDAHSCTPAVFTTHIYEPDTLVIDTIVVDSVSCWRAKDGKFDIQVSGGTMPYTYSYKKDGSSSALTFSDSLPTGLDTGTYVVTVNDAHSCTPAVFTTHIYEPDTLVIDTIVVDSVSCWRAKDGKLDIQVSGGTMPYTYSYKKDGSGSALTFSDSLPTGLDTGTYVVTVNDAHGCTPALFTTHIYEPDTLVIDTIVVDSVSCWRAKDGKLEIQVSGGTMPYTYSYKKDGSSSALTFSDSLPTGLDTGTYVVTVNDYHGCTPALFTTHIYEPDTLMIDTIVVDSVSCWRAKDGKLDIQVSGGTMPYTYSYKKDGSGSALTFSDSLPTGLDTGTYVVTVNDANSCTPAVFTTHIYEPDTLVIDTIVVDSVSCWRAKDGKLDIQVSGGTMPYTYSYKKDGSGSALTFSDSLPTGLDTGTYVVTVNDAHGCTPALFTTHIYEPDTLVIDTIVVDSVSCWRAKDGKFDIQVSGGTMPYTYSYKKDGSSSALTFSDSLPTGLDTGTYVVTVNDANSCTPAVFTTHIYEPDTLVIDTIVVDSVSCWRAKDGKLDIQVSGGTMPYTYSYKKDGSGSALTFSDSLPTGLDTGTYVVTVNDANSCTPALFTTHIYEPDTLVIDTIVVDSVSCWRAKDGKLDIQVSGGTMPYTYSYKKDGSSSALTFSDSLPTGLDTGTYVVTVNDANSCTPAVFTTHIYEPDTLVIDTIVVDSVSCWRAKDGKLDIQVSGGTMPYTYSYKKDGSSSALTFSDSLPTGLDTGTYVVTVNDYHGCTPATFTTHIYEPDTLMIDTIVVDSVSCWRAKDGKLDIQVSGGTMPYTYSYKKDGSSSALTFSDSLPTGLDTGTYVVTVNDAHNCTPALFTTHIYEPSSLSIDTIIVDSVQCNGDSNGKIDVQVSGGTMPYTYSYKKDGSGSALTFSDSLPTGLDTGTYVVTVNDAHGCTPATFTTHIYEPDTLMIDTIVVDSVSCWRAKDGKFDIQVSGGTMPYTYSYVKDDGTSVVLVDSLPTGLDTGTYVVTVNDAHNCNPALFTTHIYEPSSLSIDTIIVDSVQCNGDSNGKIDVQVSGGTYPYSYTYSFTGVSSVDSLVDTLSAGFYNVLVTDANNCSIGKSFEVKEPAKLVVDTIKVDSVACFGTATGSLSVEVSGGTLPYEYSVDGMTYQTDTVIANLNAGIYTVSVRDAAGCETQKNVAVLSPVEFLIKTISVDSVTCFDSKDGRIEIHAEGGVRPYKYSIDGGVTLQYDSVFSNLGVATYPIYVEDAKGCVLQQSVEIPNLSASLVIMHDVLFNCLTKQYTVVLWGEGGSGTYEYNFGKGWSTTNESDPLYAASYVFYMRDIRCDLALKIELSVPFNERLVDIQLPEDLCFKQPVDLSIINLEPNQNYDLYYHEDGVSKEAPLSSDIGGVAPLQTDAHDSSFVMVLDSLKSYSDTLCEMYRLRKTVPIKLIDCSLKIYDVFTPNNDGYNDYFTIDNIQRHPGNLVQIFNRWGELVYEKQDYNNDWSGVPNRSNIAQDKHLPFGAYFCVLTIPGMEVKHFTIYIVR